MTDRRLAWEACYNVRDLGGLPTSDGRAIRWRAFVRADNLVRLTATGRRSLLDYGVRTIIDLRAARELEIDPSPFAESKADLPCAYRHLSLDAEAFQDRLDGTESMHDIDVLALEHNAANIARIASTIADAPDGAVVVHCHAGKDRTGFVVALLLALVGVRDESIAEDYAASDECLRPLYDEWLRKAADPAARARLAARLVSRPESILATLSHLRTRYGGAERYLRRAGLDGARLRRIEDRLVETR